MKIKSSSIALQGASALVTVLAAAATFATQTTPDSAGTDLQEIVVTAQKRSENAQTVPITIAAFTASMLAQANIASVVDLPRVVSTLRLGTTPGGIGTRYVIRGVGSFGNSALEPSVAVFVDDIYVPRPASLIGTFMDVSGLEVLSGPQGTIFGRNASAGAISIHTGSPTSDRSIHLNVQQETGQLYRLDGSLNLPVNDRFAVRLAVIGQNFGGYWQNTTTGHSFGGLDTRALRLSMKAELAPSLTWIAKADTQHLYGDYYLNYQLDPATLTPTTLANITAFNNGIVPDLNLFDRKNNVASNTAHVDDTITGVSSDLAFDLAGDYTLRLLQGYHEWDAREVEADPGGLSVLTNNRDVLYNSKSQSHELQFLSPTDRLLGGHLSYLAGLYYFKEDLHIRYQNNIFKSGGFCEKFIGTAPARAVLYNACANGPEQDLFDVRFAQKTESVAAFEQATVRLAPTVKMTLGARWTRDLKNGAYKAAQADAAAGLFGVAEDTPDLHYAQSRATYRANLAWTPFAEAMIFATYSTGFKSGGFNSGSATTVLGQLRQFKPETVKNTELGWKSRFFDRRFTFNTTIYRMDVDGYQERAANGVGGSILRNVGSLRNQGADLEVAITPNQHFSANTTISYLDSKFLSYAGAPVPVYQTGTQDLTGKPVTYAPKWSLATGAQIGYDIGRNGLRWQLHGDLSYTGAQFMGSQIDEGPLTRQQAYRLLGARFTLFGHEDRWSVALFGRNLTDQGYCTSRVYNPLDSAIGLRYPGGTAVRCSVGAPRTVGLNASMSF